MVCCDIRVASLRAGTCNKSAEILHLGRSVSLQSRGRLEEFCQYAAACLESCKPRKIHAGGDLRLVLIFTDASWESQVGGLGAVVIDTAGGRVAIYSGQVDDSLKHHWMKEIGDHLICQLVITSVRLVFRAGRPTHVFGLHL